MTEERIQISKEFLEKMAPCIISYPINNIIAKAFIAPTGETFKYGYSKPYTTLEQLGQQNSIELLQMFSGQISHLNDINDLLTFQNKLIDDLDEMRGHYGKPDIPHPSEIQQIQDRLHELSHSIF